jgi:transposase
VSARHTEASARAAALVAGGLSYRAAAAAAGVALSTCVAACKRLGVVSTLRPGAPARVGK